MPLDLTPKVYSNMTLQLPRGAHKLIARDSRFRSQDCIDFDANVTARRPMRPPPVRLAERTISPGARDAARAAGRSTPAPRDDDAATLLEAETEDALQIVRVA